MGNADSNITSAIKKQTDSESLKIYSLISVKGGGELVAMMKEAASNPSSSLDLEDRMRKLVEPFLYDKGAGRKVPISKLVLTRNKDRPKNKQLTPPPPSDASEDQGPWKEVCWDLDQRGSVGETALHLCFLVYTPLHMKLAKHLVKLFPKLVNDVYQGEEYYGENVLHMAIGNEDPFMAKFLLNHGANFEERAVGNFFCPEDQKAGRTDSLEHEWVDLPLRTNYEGYVYTGEYPLSFAARLNQEECYRLLLAKGACPDRQDTNGNTLVHILVIQDNIEMLDVAFDLGASLTIKNRQGFTPLGLAAKLARKRMFFHLLDIQRDIYWEMGNITCTAYPLQGVDTTDCSTGEIDRLSVLNVVAYGEHPDHLDMLDGLLIDLLNAKWNTYVKFRFYRQFLTFFLYFVCSTVCFISRPKPVAIPCLLNNSTTDPCYLMLSGEIQVRWGFEILSVGGAFLYLLDAAREARFLGYHIFIENLMTVPSRVLFLFSCFVLMVMVPLRLTCSHQEEDVAAVIVMLTTAPYFLFFCRGFKIVGPFVVMIYKMIVTDLLCFTIIYMVFVLGFSQAYYVLFRSYTGEKASFFADPLQSILTMFVMSLSEFGDVYDQFQYTEHEGLAKSLFIVYMILVTTLLINMLIAMMGKTYQDIAERRNEWLRQWARIVLVVERGVSPQECLLQQCNYSHETAGSGRKLVRRLEHNEEEKEELRRIEEMKSSNMHLRKKWGFSL